MDLRTPSHRYTSSVGGISAFANSVSLSSNVVSIGSDSSCHTNQLSRPQYAISKSLDDDGTHRSRLQEPDRVQRLLDIRHLVLQARDPPLQIRLHELVLAVRGKSPCLSITIRLIAQPFTWFRPGNSRDHLLKAAQRGLDVRPRRDVVLDLVDERRERYASGVRGRILAGGGAPVCTSSSSAHCALSSCFILFILSPQTAVHCPAVAPAPAD